MAIDKIVVKGAKVHNLKNIDVEIPRDKFVVITGLSGSGKSSLAFDTIYAEGQRRYVESLSAYARQFLGQMDKPDVEYIEGLSPAISIDQKTTSRNPRSTVGTVTEIHDYLRLLFARIGIPHCPKCGKAITQQTIEQMVDKIMGYEERTKLQILAPVVQGRKGEHKNVIEDLKKSGFVRIRVNGEIKDINDEINLEKNKKHSIEVVVDRIIVKEGIENRLADSLEIALKLSEGLVYVLMSDEEELMFSQNFACVDCGISLAEITPRMFSFNSPFGACNDCDGLGTKLEIDPDIVIPDKSISLEVGAIAAWSRNSASYYYQLLNSAAEQFEIDLTIPVKDLPKEKLKLVLYGSTTEKIKFKYTNIYNDTRVVDTYYEGVIPNLERRFRETNSESARTEIEKFMSSKHCLRCKGARLRPEALAVKINDINIADISNMTILEAKQFMDTLELSDRQILIARQILKEIKERLGFLVNVGLDYLNLSRSAGTLSGGEAQRIRLATQIGSGLVGVLYILDEPSIGLHQRDNNRLIKTLENLRDLGNTLIVVEHDEDTMLSADHIIDIGPKAGAGGGKLVAQGTIEDIKNAPESITGQYLTGAKKIEIPKIRREMTEKKIEIKKASENNLKNANLAIPLGLFTCVTGVSGSGKSTLINEILLKALESRLYPTSKAKPGKHQDILGIENLDKVINIDQSPIGRTPRSNPATYTGVFDAIREVFSQTTDARMRGYKPGRFSFNVKGGRCEACSGDGIIKIEMHFLPDVYVPCEICKGKRYNRETLEIRYKGKTISEVLGMTVEEGVEFFQNIPKIHRKLKTLDDVGLGYIRLGQPATTLSGGEAQRVKLATELSRRSNGKTLYILDEPTTGLHIADIHKLLDVLNRLVEAGDSVVVIEHNLDVIKCADYIVDLGPEGGDRGGQIIATGTPEEIANTDHSYTGQYLKKVLNKG
ncbi:Excinuclease ABC subunit A [Desulfonispora thiosulfatigenes DSM 11270]|uniref:UvrABC system protein A n=1 Tax=Desulfonispora thiosulfatigenes DSM 11270 TaxID=656914 RepID=A0A1W1UWX7_DESTI|nr:excinuclease ABC subunit UvrA [Desulfonispora thiosulfatigenes]SMB85536.1 Excinuclease ABC subunit A [Desulfonispora thiosulfatigenes DSM 11270]